jgi:hypothetical protein
MATGAIAEPIAGVAGIVQGLNPFAGPDAAAKAVEATREALTFQPESKRGQELLQEIGETVEPVAEKLTAAQQAASDFAFDLTGSPAVASAVATIPAAAAELTGLKVLKAIRPGTKLLDESGRPTKSLRKVLDKQGLDFDNLTPEVRDAIPAVAEQIKAGGTEDSLAGLKVVSGNVVADKVANEAIRQGLRPGVVQSIKNSSPSTKNKMQQMARIMRRVKKSERVGVDIRPTDVVGEAVTERISFIRKKADNARLRLDKIANEKLRGQEVDFGQVRNALDESLDDLDISLIDDPKTGRAKPVFEGSIVSKNRASQRAIKDMVDLVQEVGQPDALRLHKLKRQLDDLIDFGKTGQTGISKTGQDVLKKIRREINSTLRSSNKQYAEVNDILSSSLDSMGELDKAVGSIDIFGESSKKAIGTKMRALLSNQQGRVRLQDSLDLLNETASKLGGKFDDDIKDLALFADALDERFGTTARTSLAGQVEQATRQAMDVLPTRRGIVSAGIEKVAQGAEKLRGVNDFNAFEAIDKLLK